MSEEDKRIIGSEATAADGDIACKDEDDAERKQSDIGFGNVSLAMESNSTTVSADTKRNDSSPNNDSIPLLPQNYEMAPLGNILDSTSCALQNIDSLRHNY